MKKIRKNRAKHRDKEGRLRVGKAMAKFQNKTNEKKEESDGEEKGEDPDGDAYQSKKKDKSSKDSEMATIFQNDPNKSKKARAYQDILLSYVP